MTSARPGRELGQRGLSKVVIDSSLASVAVMVITLITGILLSRILGPEGRGIYGSALFWAQLGLAYLTFSIFEANVIRLRAKGEEASHHLPSLLLISSALAAVSVLIAALVIFSGAISVQQITPFHLMLFFGGHLMLGIFNKAFETVETASLRFTMLNVERVVSPVLFMLAVITLATGHVTLVTIFLAALVATKVPVLLVRFIRFRHDLVGRVDGHAVRDSIKLGLKLSLPRGAATLVGEADRMILVPLWPNAMLGYYFVAISTCGAALSLAASALNLALLPSLSGLERDEKRRKVEQLVRLSCIVGIGLIITVWILAPVLVPLVFGEAFTPAADYARGLVFSSAFLPLASIINISLYSEERSAPGMMLAIVFLAVLGAGFALTGFAEPGQFFVTYGLANCASAGLGLYFLSRYDLVRIGRWILPGPADVAYLVTTFWRYVHNLFAKAGYWLSRG